MLFGSLTYAQAPYASYPLDGTADDTSSNNLDGLVYGSPQPTTNRFNQPGKALNFNGMTDYIVLPDDFDDSVRTVLLWFFSSQTGSDNGYNIMYMSDHPLLQNGMTNLGTFTDNTHGNLIACRVDYPTFVSNLNLNTWYQIAVVRTPRTVKFYINGTSAYSGVPNNTKSNNTTSYMAVVGADRGFLAKFFGKIDDLEIYNRALSDCEIATKYFTGSNCTPTCTTQITIYDTTTVSISVTDTLVIEAELGVGSNNINTMKAYPNPAKNHLIIDNGDYAGMSGYTLKISNALSQDVFVSPINQQKFDIDLNTWTGNGTYVLYVINPSLQVVATKKIIIQ